MAGGSIIKRIVLKIQADLKPLMATQSQFKGMVKQSGELKKRFAENSTRMGKFNARMRFLTAGLRGFRMEMLSVMFFGMAMQKFFGGLLRPSLELVGVFDVMRNTLGIFFLPVALQILDWVLALQNFLLSLSPEAQKFIGWVVVAGAVLGAALFFIGMFTLGIGGLITALAPLGLLLALVLINPIQSIIAAIVGTSGLTAAIAVFGGSFGFIGDAANVAFKRILEIFPNFKKKLDELGIDTEDFGEALSDVWTLVKEAFREQFGEIAFEIEFQLAWIANLFKVVMHIAMFKMKKGFNEKWPEFKENFEAKFVELVESVIKILGRIPIRGLKRLGGEFNIFNPESELSYVLASRGRANQISQTTIPGALPPGTLFIQPIINISAMDPNGVRISSNEGVTIDMSERLATKSR